MKLRKLDLLPSGALAFLGEGIIVAVAFGLMAGAMPGGGASARARSRITGSAPKVHRSAFLASTGNPHDSQPGSNCAAAQPVPSLTAAASGKAPPAKLIDATDAILRAFQTHDIVMLGEVHGSQQEYEWLCNLIKAPGFGDHVNDIVVEFGNARYQVIVDRYVAGRDVPFNQVQKAWRDMVADAEPVSPVYGFFYRAVREANLKNPRHRIRLIMGSPPADWSGIKTAAELAPYLAEREQWYANQVKHEVLARHHRALLITGAGHFTRGHDGVQSRPVPPLNHEQATPASIEQQLRAAGANPYVVVLGSNAIDGHGDTDPRFASWPTPVIVSLSGNWVGNLPAHPVLTDGHVPATSLTLADEADAMLYVAPCSALQLIYPSRAEIQGTPYGREVARRGLLFIGRVPPFLYGRVPQCAQPSPVTK